MKNVKMPSSDSYHDYLISSLKEPEESAMYIEVTLAEGEPKLLNLAIGNVVEGTSLDFYPNRLTKYSHLTPDCVKVG